MVFAFCIQANAEVLVIMNSKNPIKSLEKKKIIELFMGKATAFPNRKPAITLDFESGSDLRRKFYKSLTGKSEAQIDAYWAQLVFGGRMSQPKKFKNEKQIINAVLENPSTIAFVSKQTLPRNVKVVAVLTE